MSRLERQLAEDRALRDAALRLFQSDLALIQASVRERSVGARITDRVGDATMDMIDDAIDYADANRGKVAAGALAVVLWFARGPIIDRLAEWLGLYDDQEHEDDSDRSADR